MNNKKADGKKQPRPVDAASFPACHGAGGIVIRHIVPARKTR